MGTTRTRPPGAGAPKARPARLTRTWLRVVAWVVGALAFFGPWAGLGLSPKPASSAAATVEPVERDHQRPRRVIHRRIRRVIIVHTVPAAPTGVNVIYAGGSSSGGYSGGGSGGSSGGGTVASTGGS